MKCKRVLLIFLFQTAAIFAAEETPTFSRSSYYRTLKNKQLKGHVVKRFDSPSLLSCGQQCMKNEWCTSTNYKMPSKKEGKGTCELNKHDISLINENTNFHDQQGVTFSMLLKGCLMTSCLNGGSCLPDEENETFSCSCKPSWTGETCEVYHQPDELACPQGWVLHGNSCYNLVSKTKTHNFTNARAACQSLGGDLAIIRSQDENSFIFDFFTSEGSVSLWLGLYRKADTKFYWIDDTPLEGQYSEWASGEPSNVEAKCVHIYATNKPGKWNDGMCKDGLAVLCQKNSI